MTAERAEASGLGETRSGADSPSNPLGLVAGTLVGGRYRSGRMLGRGAMGVVFEGTHHELDERVAIKFLLPDHLENQEIVGRFAREAKAAVKLKGEHVARVLDVGKHDGRIPYIIMEYLDGEDLGRLVDENGPLPVDEACGYLIEACAGLAEAHARGIVHRDVKPENLYLTRLSDGRQKVKILDFGVSKVVLTGTALEDVNLAATSTMLGSPLYMSPEQIRSREIDHRSDIWSLGVALYELLAGQTPFHSANITELVGRVLEDPPPSLRDARPEVPAGLEHVVLRCLRRDPAERWESVAALAIALLPYAPRASREVAEQARAHVARADRSASLPRIPLPPVVPQSIRPAAALPSEALAVAPANDRRGQAQPKGLIALALVALITVVAGTVFLGTRPLPSPQPGQLAAPVGVPAATTISGTAASPPSATLTAPETPSPPAASVVAAPAQPSALAAEPKALPKVVAHLPHPPTPPPPPKPTAAPPLDDIRLTR